MAWNWQQSDWPHFRCDADSLKHYETQFLHNVGVQIGSSKHFDEITRQLILVDTLTGEAVKTSEIEGEILNRESVQSSILGHFGYPSEKNVCLWQNAEFQNSWLIYIRTLRKS